MHEITITCIGLYLIASVIVWQFSALQRDNFRSSIRRLRDELFDYMWKNGHSYQDVAYIEVRQTLNGLLRASNSISIGRFFITAYYHAQSERAGDKIASINVNTEDAVLQGELNRILKEAMSKFLRFVFITGIRGVFVRGLLLGVSCAISLVRAGSAMGRMKSWLYTEASRMFSDASRVGAPNMSTQEYHRLMQC